MPVQYRKDLVLVGSVPIPLLTHGTPEEDDEYEKYLFKGDFMVLFPNIRELGNPQWCSISQASHDLYRPFCRRMFCGIHFKIFANDLF